MKESGSQAFRNVEALYEELGEEQALWAVLTYPEYRDDENVTQFFETGVTEIEKQMKLLKQLKIRVERGACLDFGCGVGRLSNALAPYFNEVTGIDVSSSMIRKAEEIRKYENITYLVNKQDNLAVLQPNSFDFVYSNKTLQHIPYPASKNYIQGFINVLKPDGVAVFLVHNCQHTEEGSWQFNLAKWYRETIRPFFKKLRGKPPVQIHPISSQNVRKFVEQAGGEILHAETDTRYTRRRSGNLRTWYWVRKSS